MRTKYGQVEDEAEEMHDRQIELNGQFNTLRETLRPLRLSRDEHVKKGSLQNS